MPSEDKTGALPVDGKAIDLFVDRLAEILLMQIEHEQLSDVTQNQNEQTR